MGSRAFAGTRAASLCAAVAWLATGCVWLYGPSVELPKDTATAVERPAIGARALMRANEIELELLSWGPLLQTSIDSLGPEVSAVQSDALRASIRRTYAPQRLFDRMATSIASGWDPDAAREIFAFYESWLGQRVLRAQANRRDARALVRFQAWSEKFDARAYSAERVAILRRLDRALLTSQTAVWLNRALLDAGLGALGDGVSSAAAAPIRALRARTAAEEAALYPVAQEQVLRWNLYAYAWISDSDLERYAAFAESTPAQWWVVTSVRGYRVTLSGAGADLFQALRPRNTY